MADKNTHIEQIREEFEKLKAELFDDGEFVANDENLPKWRRYNRLLGYFHPDYRSPYWVNPLGTEPISPVKTLLVMLVRHLGITLRADLGERKRERHETQTLVGAVHKALDQIEFMYPEEKGKHRDWLPERK